MSLISQQQRRSGLSGPNTSTPVLGLCLVTLFLLYTIANAQDSRFLFDAHGNLSAQTPDFIALPQITGQPQNQVVATNELAAFSVVVADPRLLSYQWQFNG